MTEMPERLGAARGSGSHTRVQRRTSWNLCRRWIAPGGAARPRPCPAFTKGARPATRGRRYPPDPPSVEEIIAVMRACASRPEGVRLRAVIVVLWRAGLRISEALALSESDLDRRRGAVLVRDGKGGKRREVGMDRWGWEQRVLYRGHQQHQTTRPR